jgi:hypothetical protein
MQRKQVGECWVCVIFFSQVVVFERLRWAHRGVRGGAARPPLGGCRGPQETCHLPRETCHIFRWFFDTWFLPMVFYFWLRN